jgi:hypothetical protein
VKRAIGLAALTFLACWGPGAAGAASSSDPDCVGAYGGAAAHAGTPLRFGIDPGIAGSAGGVQLPSTPDDSTKDLSAVQALAPPGRVVVVRLNRLFWSDGQAGIDAFQQQVARYTSAGFEVELQVRYHPPSGQAGDIPAWVSYVRRVVDSFGPNLHVVAMTITNEVNVPGSANTSDGAYAGAQDALIAGIEAAHAEALQRGFTQLRFGFTYAYRFSPSADAGFFSYLGAHGGQPFLDALGFVGLDFYPGTIYPPAMAPGDTYRAELAQAPGTVRDCLAPKANIGGSCRSGSPRTEYPPGQCQMPSRLTPCSSWYRPRTTTRAPSTSPTIAGSTCATRPRAVPPRSSARPSPPMACSAMTTPPSHRSPSTAP